MDSGHILKGAFPELESNDPVTAFGQIGDVFHALSYAWLFWPRVIEIYGAAFLAFDGDDERVILQRLSTPYRDVHPEWPPMTWEDVVNSYNRFEIGQLFRRWRGPAESVPFAESRLAEFLVRTWRYSIVESFPGREFSVRTAEDDTNGELWIEVRQESPALSAPQGWNSQRSFVEVV